MHQRLRALDRLAAGVGEHGEGAAAVGGARPPLDQPGGFEAVGEEAVIAGTRIGVWFIVRQLRTGDTPEDIVASLPHLTLAGIYDAISYYHDHRAEIDPIIEYGDPMAALHDA